MTRPALLFAAALLAGCSARQTHADIVCYTGERETYRAQSVEVYRTSYGWHIVDTNTDVSGNCVVRGAQ